jgi:4-amino-4-deoxy-L-arabinose transferase-like glycosyltransferase
MLLVNLAVPEVTIMEARNFITAREMIQDDNWILTTMNGEPRYQKPPLPTWLTALSGLLFGINSLFALRLPAALMVAILGVLAYFLSRKLNLTKQQSLISGLLLITSFYVFAIINEAPWDIFTHGFMLTGLYFLFQFFTSPKVVWKAVIFSGIFIGFSILSKGPISLYALFLPFLIAYGIVFKYKNFKIKIVPSFLIIILFILIGGWWFYYVRLADPEAFIAIANKETGNWSSYNVRPFYYYWSFFTQSGIWTIPAFIGLLYPYLIKRVKHKNAYKFTFWWTIIAVILLSVIPEKKARYLMPVLIPLALNTSFYILHLIKSFSSLKSKKETIPVYFNFGLIGLLGILIPFALFILLKESISNYIIPFSLVAITLFLLGVFILRNLYSKKIKPVFYGVILFVISVLVFGLPISKAFNNNDSYNSIVSLKGIEKKRNITSYSIGEIAPEFIWEYNGKIKNIYKNDLLKLPEENSFGLLILTNQVENISEQLNRKYHLEKLTTYNINTGTRSKERLIRQFYLVSKK